MEPSIRTFCMMQRMGVDVLARWVHGALDPTKGACFALGTCLAIRSISRALHGADGRHTSSGLRRAIPQTRQQNQDDITRKYKHLHATRINQTFASPDIMASPRAGVARPVPTGLVAYTDIHTLGTMNAELGDIKDASIVVDGNTIAWVGATAAIPEEYSEAKHVSLAGLVVIPGLVNTHHHMFQTLTRCVAEVSAKFACILLCNSIQYWRRPGGRAPQASPRR